MQENVISTVFSSVIVIILCFLISVIGEKTLAQHFMASLGEDDGFCQILKGTKGKPVSLFQ